MTLDTENLILEQLRHADAQLRELRFELRTELSCMREDIRESMIEMGALKVKVAAIAAVAALIAAAFMQVVGQFLLR